MTVANDMVVSIRYVMKNDRGEVLESNMDAAPVSYLHGSGTILRDLQQQLEGSETGATKIVHLVTNDNERYTFDVIIDKIRPAINEEMIFGYPLALDNADCGSDCDCYK